MSTDQECRQLALEAHNVGGMLYRLIDFADLMAKRPPECSLDDLSGIAGILQGWALEIGADVVAPSLVAELEQRTAAQRSWRLLRARMARQLPCSEG